MTDSNVVFEAQRKKNLILTTLCIQINGLLWLTLLTLVCCLKEILMLIFPFWVHIQLEGTLLCHRTYSKCREIQKFSFMTDPQ